MNAFGVFRFPAKAPRTQSRKKSFIDLKVHYELNTTLCAFAPLREIKHAKGMLLLPLTLQVPQLLLLILDSPDRF